MDYERDCAELSLTQHGVYFNLMRWYYATGKPIPAQPERIYRRIGAQSIEEMTTTDFVLTEFFILDGPVWRHTRIDRELATARARTEKAQEAARIRWETANPNRINETTNASASSEHMHGSCQSQPQSQSQKPNTKTRAKKRAMPDDFGISDHVKTWAADKGHDRLDERLTHFVGYATANGKQYANWDQAFMNAIRDNWAKLETGKTANGLGQWWLSESGIRAAAESVGLQTRSGETWKNFEGRIREAMRVD